MIKFNNNNNNRIKTITINHISSNRKIRKNKQKQGIKEIQCILQEEV